jgi:hypothetical protein
VTWRGPFVWVVPRPLSPGGPTRSAVAGTVKRGQIESPSSRALGWPPVLGEGVERKTVAGDSLCWPGYRDAGPMSEERPAGQRQAFGRTSGSFSVFTAITLLIGMTIGVERVALPPLASCPSPRAAFVSPAVSQCSWPPLPTASGSPVRRSWGWAWPSPIPTSSQPSVTRPTPPGGAVPLASTDCGVTAATPSGPWCSVGSPWPVASPPLPGPVSASSELQGPSSSCGCAKPTPSVADSLPSGKTIPSGWHLQH